MPKECYYLAEGEEVAVLIPDTHNPEISTVSQDAARKLALILDQEDDDEDYTG